MSKKRLKILIVLAWLIPSYFFVGMSFDLLNQDKMEYVKSTIPSRDAYVPVGKFPLYEVVSRVFIWFFFWGIVMLVIFHGIDIEERNGTKKSKTKRS